jgi:mRNA interferase HicA
MNSGIIIDSRHYFLKSYCVLCIIIYAWGDKVKQRDLVNKLMTVGFVFERHGGNHDIYRRGSQIEKLPRHKEINEKLARAILRKWGLNHESGLSDYFYTDKRLLFGRGS